MGRIKWSDFMNPEKKIAINCQTEDDAEEFLQMLDARGVKWRDGESLLCNSMFSLHDLNTAYAITHCPINGYRGISYSQKNYYEQEKFTIYRYSEVEFVDDNELVDRLHCPKCYQCPLEKPDCKKCRKTVQADAAKTITELLDRAERAENQLADAGWISVEDRLPEDDLPEDSKRQRVTVLVCVNGKTVSLASRIVKSPVYKTVHERIWAWSKDKSHVTHWMPLPKPPKEENP